MTLVKSLGAIDKKDWEFAVKIFLAIHPEWPGGEKNCALIQDRIANLTDRDIALALIEDAYGKGNFDPR